MILVNTDYIAGKELEMLGLVKEAPFRRSTWAAILHRCSSTW